MDPETLTSSAFFSPAQILLTTWITLLLVFYFYILLTPRPRFRPGPRFVLTILLVSVVQATTPLTNSHYILKVFLELALFALLPGLLYEDSLIRRVLISLFAMLLLMLAEGIISALLALIWGLSIPTLINDPALLSRYLWLFLTIYGLCFALPILISRRRHGLLPAVLPVRFLLLPLSQVILIGGYLYACFLSRRPFGLTDGVITAVMLAVSVLVDVIFFRVVADLLEKDRLELQMQHYEALAEHQQELRFLRHDLANHLMTARILAREDPARSESYLEELNQLFQEVSVSHRCENRIADAVLYRKGRDAVARGIRLEVDAVLPEAVRVRPLDLMSVLSNLLDNALDAAEQAEDPAVEVYLRRMGRTVLISVSNSVPAQYEWNPGKTRKAEPALHGQGLSIVRKVCAGYHGSFQIRMEDDRVRADALLMETPETGGGGF